MWTRTQCNVSLHHLSAVVSGWMGGQKCWQACSAAAEEIEQARKPSRVVARGNHPPQAEFIGFSLLRARVRTIDSPLRRRASYGASYYSPDAWDQIANQFRHGPSGNLRIALGPFPDIAV